MAERLKNKVALITGTGRGIGRVMVEEFAREGADVIAHYRRIDPEHQSFLNEVAARHNVKISHLVCDLCDEAQVRTEVMALKKQQLIPDILVNGAAMAHGGFFQMTPIKSIREVFEINFFAQLTLTQYVLKLMARRKQGSIINMGSISGLDLNAGNCAYGVSKAALMAFTQTLAAECAPLGIRVNALAPGLTDTQMGALMEEKAAAAMIAASAMKRMATPREIAQSAVFLASDESSFINGQIIRIDGGHV